MLLARHALPLDKEKTYHYHILPEKIACVENEFSTFFTRICAHYCNHFVDWFFETFSILYTKASSWRLFVSQKGPLCRHFQILETKKHNEYNIQENGHDIDIIFFALEKKRNAVLMFFWGITVYICFFFFGSKLVDFLCSYVPIHYT